MTPQCEEGGSLQSKERTTMVTYDELIQFTLALLATGTLFFGIGYRI